LKKREKFVSAKKILREIGAPYDQVELFSLNSTSTGFMQEGGLRGGYCEATNIDPEII